MHLPGIREHLHTGHKQIPWDTPVCSYTDLYSLSVHMGEHTMQIHTMCAQFYLPQVG